MPPPTQLAGCGIPETLQHDDLHDGNVFVRDGRYLLFDWGDSCVSHPFHTLVVTFRAIAHRFQLDLQPGGPELLRLRNAYLEPFADHGTHVELVAAVDLAHLTGTAGRTLAWHRFVSAREPEFRADDVETVPYGLKRLLDLGPLGSWS
jgi:aminoglycoside phosphotransferase (APT) family kinase protein